MNKYHRPSYRRTRNRGFACSDELWYEIIRITKGAITVSSFVRNAVKKEIELRDKNEQKNA